MTLNVNVVLWKHNFICCLVTVSGEVIINQTMTIHSCYIISYMQRCYCNCKINVSYNQLAFTRGFAHFYLGYRKNQGIPMLYFIHEIGASIKQ